jgi:hypothetical protein
MKLPKHFGGYVCLLLPFVLLGILFVSAFVYEPPRNTPKVFEAKPDGNGGYLIVEIGGE